MKKIILCSAITCEGKNFGDWLMLNLLEEKIYSIIPDACILYTGGTNYGRFFVRSYFTADAFIFTPGGYLGYIEKWYSGSIRKTIQRMICYYLPGIIFSIKRRPMALFGQGIGPYEYPLLSKMLKYLANCSDLITVRDQVSYDLLRNIGVIRDIHITADCSQVLNDYDLIWETKESSEIKEKLKDKTKIYICYCDNTEWKQKIVQALSNLMKHDDYGFVLGADNQYNREELHIFSKLFPKERTVIFDYRDHRQLLSIYNEIDAVLTCKLHTGIVGCTMSKSVIAFALQYEKTKLYYEKIGYSERVTDLFTTTAMEMKDKIEKYINQPIQLSDDILKKAHNNFELLEDFLKRI